MSYETEISIAIHHVRQTFRCGNGIQLFQYLLFVHCHFHELRFFEEDSELVIF